MYKRQLHHQYKRLLAIRPWYFLLAGVIFLAIGVMGLRANNFEAIRLRDEVIKADEQNGDVEVTLRDLRQHIYSHMNAGLSGGTATIQQPIQLKYRYERLLKEETKQTASHNAKVRKDAENVCKRKYPGGGFNSARINCVAKYVADNTTNESEIPSELYKFDFISPSWTPDKAGFSLLLAFGAFAIFTLILVVNWWYKYEL